MSTTNNTMNKASGNSFCLINKIAEEKVHGSKIINDNVEHYRIIIEGLSSNCSTSKIKVLDKLLGEQIVDTKLKIWEELAENLRKCFVSTNNDVFIRSLKVHHRIIAFPSSSCDGYLNLLKATFLLLNSTNFNKHRIWQCLYLILNAQNGIIKLLLHSKSTSIEEVTAAFVAVVSSNPVFELLEDLDPDMMWLKNFCYGASIRNIFFSQLKEKYPDFIKNIWNTFMEKYSHDRCNYYEKFLIQFWSYRTNLAFKSDQVTVDQVIELLIIQINKKKIKSTKMIVDLFKENPTLLSPKLLNLLTEPLTNTWNNAEGMTDGDIKYILTIISNAVKAGNCRILFGIYTKSRKNTLRKLTRTNVLQKIIDLIEILINESKTNNDGNILLSLLRCCLCLYDSHPLVLLYVNPKQLIHVLHNFYRLRWKTSSTDVRMATLDLFKFFLSHYSLTLQILDCDTEILDDLFSFSGDVTLLINRLALDDKFGFDFLKRRNSQLVKPYLEQIWSFESDNDDAVIKFLMFLFVVKLNASGPIALLAEDDDNTVVDSEGKTSLVELIEASLEYKSEPAEEHLGLLAMKVMIVNLDLLLYLQANHQVQEKLQKCEERDGLVIDAQSTLRHNILVSLELIGFVDEKLNANLETLTEFKAVPRLFEILKISPCNELGGFLRGQTVGNRDFGWLLQARRAFKKSLETFDPGYLPMLLEQIPKTYVYRKTELQWPPDDSVHYQLHPEDFWGISVILGYKLLLGLILKILESGFSFGFKTGLLMDNVEKDFHSENLGLLIKQARTFLGYQPENFTNFDWFVGITYLICSGDFDKSKTFLINVTSTSVTSLVWTTFGKQFDLGLQENFYQHFAIVLEENCSCFQALKMLNISPEILVRSWLNQCFFNFLRFEEICNFIAFAVLYPVECILYYMAAILKDLNEALCTVTHSPNLENILNMTDMSSFRLKNCMPWIEELIKHYRNSHKL